MITTDTTIITLAIVAGTVAIGAVGYWSRQQEQAQLDSLQQEVSESLDDTADRIETSVDTAVTEQVETLEQSQRELNEIGDQFEATFEEMDEAVTGFSSAIQTVDDFDGLRQWGDTLEDAAEPVERIAANVEAWQQEQQQLLSETTEVLSEWAAQHRRVEEVYEESMEGLQEWQTEHTMTQRENSEALKSRLEQLSEHSEAMRRTVSELDDVIQREAETREMLAENVPETLAGLEEVSETLSDLNRRQTETIQTLEGIAEPMNEAASTFERESGEVLEQIREQADRNSSIQDDVASTIEQSNGELRSSVTELQRSIDELQEAQTAEWVEYAKLALLAGVLVGVLVPSFI
ncbi:hypothetical protein EXE46_07735 [Halorubrum sp. GN11_10-6_MGM]|uniref:hypothetical protein n=1 Tax=Halorubrum sp. GN11_10-6_MGM TaxID=2518112 RepID=UPI0010FA5681|nr:hypothetical protein [Halorubrum sp. GN11_10-6_MGM]TKX74747.1 hypothetical protein EXE46_07735 [Halorubrum sp. GN11_10-6_MGM]